MYQVQDALEVRRLIELTADTGEGRKLVHAPLKALVGGRGQPQALNGRSELRPDCAQQPQVGAVKGLLSAGDDDHLAQAAVADDERHRHGAVDLEMVGELAVETDQPAVAQGRSEE